MINNIFESERKHKIDTFNKNKTLKKIINKNVKEPVIFDKSYKTDFIFSNGRLTKNFTTSVKNLADFNQKDTMISFKKYKINSFLNVNEDEKLNDEESHNKEIKNNKTIDRNIKVIHNVFKPNFANNVKATGFGDFIKGCYFLLQFCRENNLRCEFDIVDHPILNYLSYFKNKKKITNDIANNAHKLEKHNHHYSIDDNNNLIYAVNESVLGDFISFTNSMTIYDNEVFINVNYYPKIPIIDNDIQKIKYMLEPTPEIVQDVNKKLNKLFLIMYKIKL